MLDSALYHSPSSSNSLFIKDFENICEEIFDNNVKSILVGDFNLNYLSNEYNCTKIKNIFNMFGIQHNVRDITRCTLNSSTVIDYVLTNFDNIVTVFQDNNNNNNNNNIYFEM